MTKDAVRILGLLCTRRVLVGSPEHELLEACPSYTDLLEKGYVTTGRVDFADQMSLDFRGCEEYVSLSRQGMAVYSELLRGPSGAYAFDYPEVVYFRQNAVAAIIKASGRKGSEEFKAKDHPMLGSSVYADMQRIKKEVTDLPSAVHAVDLMAKDVSWHVIQLAKSGDIRILGRVEGAFFVLCGAAFVAMVYAAFFS